MKNLKSVIKFLLFAAIGVVVLYFAFRNQDMGELFNRIAQADFKWVLLCMACGVLAHLSRAIRWNLLLEPLNYKANRANSFYAVMVGYLVNYTIPRSGEVTRCAVLSRTDKVPVNMLVGTVLVERIFDLIMMMGVVILTFVVQFDVLDNFYNQWLAPKLSSKLPLLLGGVLFIMAVMVTLIIMRKRLARNSFYQKFSHIINGFVDGFRSILNLKRPWLFIAHSLFIWCMYFFMGYFLFYSIPATSQLGIAAGLTTLVMGSIGVIIPAPAGLGVTYTISQGLLIYGISETDGAVYATLSYATQTVMIFIVGGFSWLMVMLAERKRNNNALVDEENEEAEAATEESHA